MEDPSTPLPPPMTPMTPIIGVPGVAEPVAAMGVEVPTPAPTRLIPGVERDPRDLSRTLKVKSRRALTLSDVADSFAVVPNRTGSSYTWQTGRNRNYKGFIGNLHVQTTALCPPDLYIGIVIVRNSGGREEVYTGTTGEQRREITSALEPPLFRKDTSRTPGLYRAEVYPYKDAILRSFVFPLIYNGGVGNEVVKDASFRGIGALRAEEGFSCLVQFFRTGVDREALLSLGLDPSHALSEAERAAVIETIAANQEKGKARANGGQAAADPDAIIAEVALIGSVSV